MKKNSLPKMRLTTSVLASLLACVVTSAHAEQVTSYQYNDMGLLIGMDGPRTDVDDSTHFAYDAQGHISSLTNALGQQWQYLDYNATGNPTRIIDANGVETSLSYSDGHITALSRAGLTWQYAYDDLGQLISSTDPAGLITSRTYDDARRLTCITYPDGSVLAFTLDAAGNVTQQNLTQADGTIVSLHRFAYDELSQLLSSATEQSQQQYEYDLTGNKMAVIDGKGQQIKLQYDALNRLVGDVDRLGNTTKYAYNPQNQLVSLTDTNGGTTQYQYNNLGQLIVQQSPDTGRTTYQHDEADNLISITDARDLTVTQEFDALNRLVNRKLNNGESITYGYDEVQHGASMGKLTSLTRSGSKLSFSYLDNGLLGQFDRDYTVGGISNSFSQQFSYDSAGRLQSIQYGNEVTISYSFGADGHIDQITFSAPGATQGVAASNIRLRPDDQLSDLTLGNGLSLHREFNSGGELVSQQWGNEQTSYSYDANGNLIAHEDDSYSFDAMDRLVSMSGSHQQTYQFDNVGNRLLQLLDGQRRQYTYEPNSNRMSRINRKKVSLDVSGYLSGNPLSAAQTYQWNELGELKALWQAGKVKAKYQYNGLSQRTSKSVGNYNTLFDYTPQGHLAHVAYYNGQKLAWNRYYIWLGEQPLVQLEVKYVGKKATPTLNSLVYLQTDHLNAPYAATDSQGKTVWRWSHDPFGVGKADRNPDGDKVAIDVPLRFPGQLEDTETGLFYNWHRYYDPSTGRYISSDPLGLAAGVNTYGYVGGNPLGYVDPFGLKFAESWGAGGAAIGGSVAIGGSIVADATTGGFNILATPTEIAIGTGIGGAVGYGLGSLTDWALNEASSDELSEGPNEHAGDECPVSKDKEPNHPDFVPNKKKSGLSKIPWNKNSKGFPDKKGNYWEPVPDGHKGTHDPHWDVQYPDGSHDPVYPE